MFRRHAAVRGALRGLSARPGLTLAAILTLTLGTGATTTIFSVVDGVALRPLPFPHASRLFSLCEQFPGSSPGWCSISPPNLEDIAERSTTIDAVGFGRGWSYYLRTDAGSDEIAGGLATPGLFRALGVRPVVGRLIEPSDLVGGPSTVALISHAMWQGRFGGAPDIVGRLVTLDQESVEIVGVLEPGFALPKFETVELWRPVHINPRNERHREWRGFVAYGRLKQGVSLGAARAELAGIVSYLRGRHFAATSGWSISVVSLQDLVVGGVRRTLLVFLAAGAIVLLIACANVANLLLARGADRARELSLRAALGASRGRIVRDALVESAVLASIGVLLGVVLSVWGTEAFKALAPSGIPRLEDVQVNGRVLLFAVLLATITTFVFGLAPALRAARIDLAQALREGGRGTTTHRGRLGAALVVTELALAVVLAAGAGLLARSYAAFAAWEPGFEHERITTFSIFAPETKYPRREHVAALWDRIESSLRAVPGVLAAGSASAGPGFGGRETWEMEIEGVTSSRPSVRWYDVSPGYFDALGLPVVRGRDLGAQDVIGAPFATLVNEALARRFWGTDDPLGRRLTFGVGDDRAVFEVVGVVPDIAPLRPGDAVEPEMYWSNRQLPRPFSYFVVRAALPPAAVASAIGSALASVDPDLRVRQLSTMPELMGRALARPRFNMVLLLAFGLTALTLAAIGTHGLLAYQVSQRRRELGIRLALGARRRQIVGAVLRQALRLAAIGIVAGLLGALALGRTVASLAPGVSPSDPVTLLGGAAVLAVVATASALLPALRASRVDPAITLSAE